VVELRKYCRTDGVTPFDQWMAKHRDGRAKARILVQLDRLKLGLPGDWKAVGAGVFELRIREDRTTVVLLCAGEKSTQGGDIELARSYWRAYRRQA